MDRSKKWQGRRPVALWMAACLAMFQVFALPAGSVRAQRPEIGRGQVDAHWLADGCRFWYRVTLADGGSEFVLVDAERGLRQPAFDHEAAARWLSDQMGKEVDARRLPFRELDFTESGEGGIALRGPGIRCRLDVSSGQFTRLEGTPSGAQIRLFQPPRPSRDEGDETRLVVRNELAVPLKFFWIDRGGERIPYGEIGPGSSREQHTWAGHVFLVEGEGVSGGACFAVPEDGGEVVLDQAAVAAIGRERTAGDRPRGQRGRGSRGPGRGVPLTGRGAASPNGQWAGTVRDDKLWIVNRESGAETMLAGDADAANTFRRDTSRARLVGMQYELPEAPADQPDLVWSPKGDYLIAWQTTQVPERRVHYVESSPRGGLQPELRSYPYLKAGDPLPVPRPRLFRLADLAELPVSTGLFPNPWELRMLRWSEDGTRAFLLYNERGHQLIRLLELELATGAVRTVVEERSDTFIHYSDPGKSELRWLPGGQLLWASERSGWNHLYRFDIASGAVVNAITAGEWNVRRIEQVDDAAGVVWFFAVGILPGQDPYHEHFCRVNFDGSDLRVLTAGDGTHEIEWSPDRRYFIDRWSRVDQPPVHELRSAEGEAVCLLEEADLSLFRQRGGELPVRFVAKGRDGETDIWGIIHFPSNMRDGFRYPVLEQIYAGPHDQHVPKRFQTRHGARRLADEGFIVVQIDGMGTAWRSKAFHDVCWRNLKDAGFPDRIAWIRSAAGQFPQMDIGRVGVYGGSAGGQNAMAAVLWHSDSYRAAAADCGCHDNRMDKIWWSEQWMGWPVGEQYDACSNTVNAHRLGGALLLSVGELDRNVDPASTTQVVGQLIAADRDFEFLFVVGAGHGAGETPWAAQRRLEFFRRHLGGPEPVPDRNAGPK